LTIQGNIQTKGKEGNIKKAKISRGYVSQIENGKINLYLDTLVALAKALGVHCSDLVA
jgi:transcriptional regulator with XRE-family HTH domain